jgi:hypothetical protein
MSNPALKATVDFLMYKFGLRHPSGHRDSKGARWYPETQFDCCKSIRSPSRAYPWSYYTHCKSAVHIAHEYGVTVAELKENLKKKNLPLLLGINERIDAYVAEKLRKTPQKKTQVPVPGVIYSGSEVYTS